MIPVPIELTDVPEGADRIVMAAPDGDLTNDGIAPVEVMTRVVQLPDFQVARAYYVKLLLEEGELERLQAGEPVKLMMLGGVAPFDVKVGWDV